MTSYIAGRVHSWKCAISIDQQQLANLLTGSPFIQMNETDISKCFEDKLTFRIQYE